MVSVRNTGRAARSIRCWFLSCCRRRFASSLPEHGVALGGLPLLRLEAVREPVELIDVCAPAAVERGRGARRRRGRKEREIVKDRGGIAEALHHSSAVPLDVRRRGRLVDGVGYARVQRGGLRHVSAICRVPWPGTTRDADN